MTETDALKPGTSLQNGLYFIREVLGQGATGITYLADMRHTVEGNLGGFSTNVEVAIKEFYMKSECQRGATTLNVVIPNTKNNAQVEQYKESFIKEARKISGLSHPNIVHVLGVFKENDTVYYAMQYIRGGSIKDLMEKKGALSEKDALNFAYQVASAMDYMHVKKHMCHYDLKPGNIMIDDNNKAQLIDFGIAKNYDESGNETSTTPPGLTKGFAPLEQYSSISGFSPKSDVYSLGATLYSMLTNTIPPEPMTWINGTFTPCPDGINPKVWRIVRKTMSLSTAERPDMQTLKNDIAVMLGMQVDDQNNSENIISDDDTLYYNIKYTEPVSGGCETIYREKSENSNKTEQTVKSDKAAKHETPSQASFTKDTNPWKYYAVISIITAAAIISGFIAYRYVENMMRPTTSEQKTNTVDGQAIYDSNGQVCMVYSGEVEKGQPHGKGILTYKTDKDKDRYEGRFLNGLREDSVAALFYRNGDIYRGSFIEDHFATGTYFVNETGEYFRGTFRNNEPWNGYWYDKHNNIIERISH